MSLNKVIQTGLSLCLFAMVSACSNGGNGNGGAGDKKYGSQEKALEVASNFNRVQKVANSQSKSNKSAIVALNENNLISSGSENNIDQKMGRAINTDSCIIDSEQPTIDRDRPFDFSMRMKISGEKCPLTANYNIQNRLIQDENKIDLKMAMEINFEIRNPDLAMENDVYAASIKGGISAEGNKESSTVDGKTAGFISSKKYGQVQIDATIKGAGTQTNNRLESRLTLTIQEEVTELVQRETTNGGSRKEEFFINGKSVTEKEFEKFKRKLGLLAQGMSAKQTEADGSDDSENPNNPSNPETPGNPTTPVHPTPNPTPNPTPQPPPPVIQPTPGNPPLPPPPTDSNGNELKCRQWVLNQKTFWRVEDAILTCKTAEFQCIKDSFARNSFWTATQHNKICQLPIAKCSQVVLNKKPYWNENEIVQACTNSDTECIADFLNTHPYSTPVEAHNMCSI